LSRRGGSRLARLEARSAGRRHGRRRAVCRRAKRAVLAVDGANPIVAVYLNRLSDLLFVLARLANGGDEPLWRPGDSRD
jgi:cob(I)alamin adenosyltransferase